MLKFIGFGHKKQMGKDTAANSLKKKLDSMYPHLRVECRAFADIMYETCHKLFGWDGFAEKSYYDVFPDKKSIPLTTIGKSPRQLLIDMGTHAIRERVWEDTWVEYLAHIHPKTSNVLILITDVRFPNEFDMIKRNGGFNIRVTRPGVAFTNDVADCALDGIEFDYELLNEGNQEDLGNRAFDIVTKHLYPVSIYKWVGIT